MSTLLRERLRHLRGLGIGYLKLSPSVLIAHKKQNDFSRHISIFNLLDPNSSFLRKVGETDRASAHSQDILNFWAILSLNILIKYILIKKACIQLGFFFFARLHLEILKSLFFRKYNIRYYVQKQIHAFFYKNILYKNIKAQNVLKVKNILKIC